ncbi:hypothetical protein PCANC_17703 [Puccinia coronata f. sp. avenae]|uniref:Uncharacterized protein n=1 Tax=Puccinia coronata f. sp. avenae TaxID=200324 RepID=A0A2N5SHQ1_9BASI|nr:hypothetical protein PCANC_17703 [Puccinia coronata f. sp. avenae]
MKKVALAYKKPKLRIKDERLKIVKMEAQSKKRKLEMEEVQAQITLMKDLKDLGHTEDEIAKFLDDQFGHQGERCHQRLTSGSTSGKDGEDTDGESKSEEAPLHTLQYIPYGILSKTLWDIRNIL